MSKVNLHLEGGKKGKSQGYGLRAEMFKREEGKVKEFAKLLSIYTRKIEIPLS